jgi:hypothetical protein
MEPQHLRLIRDPRKTSILRAALIIGVSRSTIHRWLNEQKLFTDDNDLVDIDELNAIKNAQHLGRKCGKANPQYEPNPNENIDNLLDRALDIIASVWRNAEPRHRNWIKGEISKLNDEDYLNNRHAAPQESRGKIGPNGELIDKVKFEEPLLPMLFAVPQPVPETLTELPAEPATKTQPKLQPEPVSKIEPQLPPEPVPITQPQLPPKAVSKTPPQLASKPIPKAGPRTNSKQQPQTEPSKQVEFGLFPS